MQKTINEIEQLVGEKLSLEYVDRLSRHLPEMEAIWLRLYDTSNPLLSAKAKLAWESLHKNIWSGYKERRESLKERDRIREGKPGWFLRHEHVGMMMYIPHFCGDLAGFSKKWSWLTGLGVNLFHFMPLMEARVGENDGGYAVKDYTRVDPKYGSNQELIDIIDRAHLADCNIMMDIILNHTSDDHEWAIKARNGDEEYREYYHFFKTREEVREYDDFMPQIFPDTAPGSFTYNPEIGAYVMTVFNSYQWDLNYGNPKVLAAMSSCLTSVANLGMDLLRLDAAIFMWKQKGTSCQNLPQVHDLIRFFKLVTLVCCPSVAFVAEAISTPDEIVKYFGGTDTGIECEISYNAAYMTLLWSALLTADTSYLRSVWSSMPEVPLGCNWLNYVRCHDEIGMNYSERDIVRAGKDVTEYKNLLADKFLNGFSRGEAFMPVDKEVPDRFTGMLASLCGLDKAKESGNDQEIEKALRRIRLMHAGVLLVPGLPMLYSGDEIALLNDVSYRDDPEKSGDGRWLNRPLFDWDRAELIITPGTYEHRVYNDLKELIEMRRKLKFLDREFGVRIVETVPDPLLVISMGEDFKNSIIFNFGEDGQSWNGIIVPPLDFVLHTISN